MKFYGPNDPIEIPGIAEVTCTICRGWTRNGPCAIVQIDMPSTELDPRYLAQARAYILEKCDPFSDLPLLVHDEPSYVQFADEVVNHG